jgi:hypothetical protein
VSSAELDHSEARGLDRSDWVGKGVLLVLVCAASSLLLRGGSGDVLVFGVWLRRAQSLGLTESYSHVSTDYPPGSVSLLLLSSAVFSASTFWSIKLLVGVFLLGTGVIAGLWLRDITAATVMVAALAVNAAALGYLDVVYGVPLLLAMWALQKECFALFSFSFATACLIKWQPVILIPLLIVFLLRKVVDERGSLNVRRIAAAVLPGLSVCVAVGLAFGVRQVTHALRLALTAPYLSGNALNLGWLLTALHRGSLGDGTKVTYVYSRDVASWMPILTRCLFALAMLVVLAAFWRGSRTFEQLLAASIAGLLAYFLFNTGVHENHLFLACLLSVVGLWLLPLVLRTPLLIVIAMTQVNLVAFYGLTGTLDYSRMLGGIDATIPLAGLTLLAGCFVVIRMLPYLAADPGLVSSPGPH